MPNDHNSVIAKMREYAQYFSKWSENLADSPKSRVHSLRFDLGYAIAQIENLMKAENNATFEREAMLDEWREIQSIKIRDGLGPKAIKFE